MTKEQIEMMIDRAAFEGWTQSEITTMDDCSMIWFWRYGMLLRRKGWFSWASVYGTAFHSTMEEMYATGGKRWAPAPLIVPDGITLNAKQLTEKEYWERTLAVQTECYAERWKDDFQLFKVEKLERDVDIVFEGIRLRGKIDLTFFTNDGRLWLLDHKTTSRLDLKTVAGWDFRFQFMFYLWLAMKEFPDMPFAGYYINAIKKPTIRQKQNESIDAFFARLQMNMSMEPDEYYYRDRLLLTKTSISHFEETVLRPKLNRIKLLTNPDVSDMIKRTLVMNPNTNRCQLYGVCEYLPLCQHGYSRESFQFEQRGAKHEELNNEGAE